MKLLQLLKDNRGFSLIEAIITVCIVGIVTVPITMTYIGSLQDTIVAKEQLEATQLAQLCIENIKAKSDQDLMSFFDNDSSGDGVVEVREIASNLGYQGGFPNIPDGYRVIIEYDKDVAPFNEDKYKITGGSSSLSYDATISFEEGMGKSFVVGNGSEEDIFTQQLSTTNRSLYIEYPFDSTEVRIRDDSNNDGILTNFSVADLNPITFQQSSYNILINCSDTTVLADTDKYLTKIYVVNQRPTPVNLFIYQNPLTTVDLYINDPGGHQEGIINTYYNMQEFAEETHKIYVVKVSVINDDNDVVSEISTTKVIE